MIVAVYDEAGTPQAVVPLLFREATIGGLWGLPAFNGRVMTGRVCGGDVIATRFGFDHLANLWRAIFEAVTDLDVLVLDHVDRDRLEGLERSCLGGVPWTMHGRSPLMPHHRLLLPATFAELKALRSGSSLKKLLGRERKLFQEVGPTLLVEIRRPSDWIPYAGMINTLMNNSWQARLLGHGFEIEEHRAAAAAGWLRSFLLLAGQRPAAFVLGYQTDRVYTHERTGFDATLGKYSPGIVLLFRILERLYEQDTPRCMEFGEGDAEWKREWGNHVTTTRSILLVRRSLRWRLVARLSVWYQGTRRLTLKLLERTGLRWRLLRFLKSRRVLDAADAS